MKKHIRITAGTALFLFVCSMSPAITLAAETTLKFRMTEAECQDMLSPAAFSTQEGFENANWHRRSSVSRSNLVAWLNAHNAFRQEQRLDRVTHMQQVIACDKLMKMHERDIEASAKQVYAFRPSRLRLGRFLPAVLLVTGGDERLPSNDDQSMWVPNRQSSLWRDADAALLRPTRRSIMVNTEALKMERLLLR